MKEIPLTQGFVALVDDEDYEWLNQDSWCVVHRKHADYAGRSHYINSVYQGFILMHRVILAVSDGADVDHKDNNGLNNQRYNLREATRSQNSANTRAHFDGSSSYKGVYWATSSGWWIARIMCRGQQYYLGHFNSEIEAALAYDAKARELFGKFARPNFSEAATAILCRITKRPNLP